MVLPVISWFQENFIVHGHVQVNEHGLFTTAETNFIMNVVTWSIRDPEGERRRDRLDFFQMLVNNF